MFDYVPIISQNGAKIKRPCTTSHTGTGSLDCYSILSYKSDPPVSTTSRMSSRTARISFPSLAESSRNSANVCDIIRGKNGQNTGLT